MTSRILKGQPSPDEGQPNSDGTSSALPESSSGPRRGVIKQDVYSAQTDAGRIRTEAAEEASQILSQARSDAEALRAKAEVEGYESGLSEWTREILSIQNARAGLLEESRTEMLRLSVKLAEKILGRTLKDPEALGDLVLKAIRGIRHEGRILVKVRPEDLDAALAQRPRLIEEIGKRVEIEIVSDTSIKLGGCQIETATGIIDARLETQLKVLERVLLDHKTPR